MDVPVDFQEPDTSQEIIEKAGHSICLAFLFEMRNSFLK
jgi:hypothetical protein